MKFTIASKSLLSHLSAVSKVVSQKNTIAILDNFLFTIKDNMLIGQGKYHYGKNGIVGMRGRRIGSCQCKENA